MSEWKELDKKLIYDNGYMQLYENQLQDPNWNEIKRNLITTKADSVVIIAEDKGKFYLVGQPRYWADCYSLEFPNGWVNHWEFPLEWAKRELEEELGLVSNEWTDLGYFHVLNSLMRRKCFVYLASNVEFTTDRQNFPDKYEKLDSRCVSQSELHHLITSSQITDSFTLSAYALLLVRGGM